MFRLTSPPEMGNDVRLQCFQRRRRTMAALKLTDRIVADPEILGGKPIIAGTRISVQFILGQLGRGVSVDELLRQYGQLQREDILAAIEFASESVGREAFLAGKG
jgi:uncharacterized protein (DUF433 family)